MNPNATTERKIFKCKNQQCKNVLCTTDGEFIYFGDLEIYPKITGKSLDLECEKCRHSTRWIRARNGNG